MSRLERVRIARRVAREQRARQGAGFHFPFPHEYPRASWGY